MKKTFVLSGLAGGALVISGLGAALPGASAMPAHSDSASTAGMRHAVRVCNDAKRGVPMCQALVMTAANGKVRGSAKPLAAAFTPADIQKAYNLKGLESGGATVAIVDGYGYSGLENDLKQFRSTYGLPPCTTGNGCLTIIDEHGGTNYPPNNSGWDLEQALDVDMVSAACPDCKIVMVQAQLTTTDFLIAENTAATWPGVVAVSNSWTDGQMSDNPAFDHPGVAITAATGDGGYDGGEWPADDTNVVGVGGTSVFADSSQRGYHETVWAGAGSGCGTNTKPAWQDKADTTCSTKADGDISGPSDPSNGGLNVYCGSFCGGFEQVGGTSEATPMIAAVFALSGNTNKYPAKLVYKKKHRKYLYDVTTGSNGSCGVPVCTARKGWDGPTGMGTPNGVKAF